MGSPEVEPEAGIQEPWSIEAVLSGEGSRTGQGEMQTRLWAQLEACFSLILWGEIASQNRPLLLERRWLLLLVSANHWLQAGEGTVASANPPEKGSCGPLLVHT